MEQIIIDQQKLDDLCSQMPEEARVIFLHAMRILANELPLKRIKSFVDKYEHSNAVDSILAPILAEIINKAGVLIEHDIDKRAAAGNNTYHAWFAGKIIINILQLIITDIEEHMATDKQKAETSIN